MIAFRHWTCGTFIANKYIQERQSAVKTISDTSEASRLFDRQSDSEVVRGGQEGHGPSIILPCLAMKVVEVVNNLWIPP